LAQASAQTAAAERGQTGRAEALQLAQRAVAIEARFRQLDADYAASLAHWKRNEIDAERASLREELILGQQRLLELSGAADPNAVDAATTVTNRP
jgi:hypothetical protein